MKRLWSPPLRIFIPALVAATILASALLILPWLMQQRLAQYEKSVREELSFTLSYIQGHVEEELRKGLLGEAREELTRFSVLPEVATLAVVNGSGTVLLAHQLALENRPAGTILADFDPVRFREARHRLQPVISTSPDGAHLHAYFPLRLPPPPGQLRASDNGVLYLDYHLDRGKARLQRQLAREFGLAGLGILFALGLLTVALERLVVTPVRALRAVADRISAGDLDAHVTIGGRGELAQLADDLNRMARQLGDTIGSLAESRERLLTTLRSIGDGVIVTDPRGRIERLNPFAERLTGWSESEARGRHLLDVFHIVNTETRLPAENPVERAIREGRVVGLANHTTLISRDGREYQIADSAAPIRLPDGELIGVVLVFQDVTGEYRLRRELARSHDRLQRFAGALPDIAFILDEEGTYLEVFGSRQALLYAEARTLRGKKVPEVLPPAVAQPVMETIRRTLREERPQRLEYLLEVPAGERWFEGRTAVLNTRGAEPGQVAWVSVDITERKQAEARIEQLAYYDALTGLPNRRLLMDRLQHEVTVARRHHHHGALLFLDLDYFKTLNDALGHETGDALLREAAARLRASLREEDTVARLGGDEFTVLLPRLGSTMEEAAAQAGVVADKLRQRIAEPFDLSGHGYRTSISVGITLFPADDIRAEDLLRQADAAMYLSKSAGRNAVSFYRPELQHMAERRLELENALRDALAGEAFHLHYQPQVDAGGRLRGVEVLVRWEHPRHGNVPPGEFIPIMEENGTIVELGEWVLNTALARFRDWRDRHPGRLPTLSVNISTRQFRLESFPDQVCAALQRVGLPGDVLVLEITEGTVLEGVEDTIERMYHLREQGVAFSIDDFGTGYSSLAYLKRLPLDELKIDRSFVDQVDSDPDDAAITGTIIAMADHLGLRVVAEGVETRAQLEFLIARGCEQFQGFYFSRPLDETGIEALLARGPVLSPS